METEGYGYTVNRHWTLLRLMSGAVSETDGCQVIAQGKAEKEKNRHLHFAFKRHLRF